MKKEIGVTDFFERRALSVVESGSFGVGVIGAGIAGCTSALELANQGVKVSLFESSDQILSKTSDATPCRLGVGFHYMHLPTALSNLRSAISLLRYLKSEASFTFQVGESDSCAHSFKKIRYALSTESLYSVKEVLSLFNEIKESYRRLIEEDPANEVFGPVDGFYTVVEKTKFRNILEIDKISLIIETCETLFDWPIFKPYLLGKLYIHPNITIHTNAHIARIERGEGLGMCVVDAAGVTHHFNSVINCSWYGVDFLNKSFGAAACRNTINRKKCMAIVELPPELKDESFLVGYGPFCALSTRPDGTGYVTFEPVTNMGQYSFESASVDYSDTVSEEEKKRLGNAIIEGASQYIPSLIKCRLRDLKIGFVRTDHGEVDIYKKHGSHTNREFLGVYPVATGLIVNEARKHTYWRVNSKEVCRFVFVHLNVFRVLMDVLNKAMPVIADGKKDGILKKIWLSHLSSQCELVSREDLDELEKSREVMVNRVSLLFQSKVVFQAELLSKFQHCP